MKQPAIASDTALDPDDDGTERSAAPRAQDGYDRAEGLSPSARRLVAQIVQSMRQRRRGEAESLLKSIEALAPTHPEVLRLRAVLAHMQGRFGEAVALLRRAIEQRPDDALPWNNLGSALAEHGDLDAAIEAFRKCTE